MNNLKKLGLTGLVLATGAAACATVPPSSNLFEARQAQEAAKQSEAPEQAPDLMVDGEEYLRKAEKAHEDDPQSEREKHYAYLATRTYERAQAEASNSIASERAKSLQSQYVQTNEKMRREAQQRLQRLEDEYQRAAEDLQEAREDASSRADEIAKLEQRKDELQSQTDELKTSLAATTATLDERSETLAEERKRRKEAEAKAERAMEKLDEIAQIEEKNGETTITLSGQVLFAFGESKLLPAAERRLQSVAAVLATRGGEQTVIVEGHTDDKGPNAFNKKLSRDRAQAVVDFLVKSGVQASRLRAVGRGESEPIANNDSPEGRANNRRVEIIIPDRPS